MNVPTSAAGIIPELPSFGAACLGQDAEGRMADSGACAEGVSRWSAPVVASGSTMGGIRPKVVPGAVLKMDKTFSASEY